MNVLIDPNKTDAKKILTAFPLENWRRPPGRPHTGGWRQSNKTWNPITSSCIPEWSNWRGSESSTLETDVYIWCYTLLVMHVRNEWVSEWMNECMYVWNDSVVRWSCWEPVSPFSTELIPIPTTSSVPVSSTRHLIRSAVWYVLSPTSRRWSDSALMLTYFAYCFSFWKNSWHIVTSGWVTHELETHSRNFLGRFLILGKS